MLLDAINSSGILFIFAVAALLAPGTSPIAVRYGGDEITHLALLIERNT